MGPGTPPTRHPPPAQDQAPAPDQAPPEQTPPRDQAPTCAVHTGRYGQQAGGMHPTGLQSCLEYLI